MKDKSKLFFAFAVGAAIGAAITALFTTEKGNEIIDKTKSKADDLSNGVKNKISEIEKQLSDFIGSADQSPKS